MCHIAASMNPIALADLASAGLTRGGYRSTLTSFVKKKLIVTNDYSHDLAGVFALLRSSYASQDRFRIFHTQAPTGDAESSHAHPATEGLDMLWHNGIIRKIDGVAVEHNSWDTELFLAKIKTDGFKVLSRIEGSFACIYHNEAGDLFVFRNTAAPMFFREDDCSLSSLSFEGAFEVVPGWVYKIDLETNRLRPVCEFKVQTEEPYFFL